jgi:hypothetical protein
MFAREGEVKKVIQYLLRIEVNSQGLRTEDPW